MKAGKSLPIRCEYIYRLRNTTIDAGPHHRSAGRCTAESRRQPASPPSALGHQWALQSSFGTGACIGLQWFSSCIVSKIFEVFLNLLFWFWTVVLSKTIKQIFSLKGSKINSAFFWNCTANSALFWCGMLPQVKIPTLFPFRQNSWTYLPPEARLHPDYQHYSCSSY